MDITAHIFGAPGRYVQGAGVINELGKFLAPLGRHVLVVGGKAGLAATKAGRDSSLPAYGLTQTEALFGGEVSEGEIRRLAALGRAHGCDVLLASGGGKAIDAVKAAAEDLGVPAVIVPTIASNDAPASALSVLYHEDGTFHRLRPLKNSPALVLVDTRLIADAPVRQLVSGMGDALATWYEADACCKSGALNNFGGLMTSAALGLAKLCRDTLLEYGRDAVRSCENRAVTPALEYVVEANTLLSGLGFESGGVAAAHALSEGFTVLHEMHGYTHGEKVAFGLLAQLALEGRPASEIREICRFCIDVGMPVTLSDLGCADVDEARLRMAAEAAAEPGRPSHNMPFPITGGMLYEAVRAADALGRQMKAE
jgi:glycerol dehydrogenase